MTTHSMGLPHNHPDRERMEELCCLYAAGELSGPELAGFSAHLKHCSECRAQIKQFEKLILFELSSVSVSRMEHIVPETMNFASEQELLAGIRNRAATLQARHGSEPGVANPPAPPCSTTRWKLAANLGKRVLPWVGWAAAALLLFVAETRDVPTKSAHDAVSVRPQEQVASAEIGRLERGIAALQSEKEEDLRKLKQAEAAARSSQVALAQLLAQSRDENTKRAALAAERDGLRADLGQMTSELEISRKRLNEEIGAKDAIQEQLADVSLRLEKQRSEVLRLQDVAANARAPLPVTSDLSSSEAKEILGARDLHIVDVYDVDNGGKSSRVYGRVYYVNRNLLVFYAFDLSNAQKNHKAVAFQAWGYRQPRSTNAESLGLFYMDNASLNRWALRVSDPQLLARIDTLFVTLEPVGGSRTPKGQRLLMASLAGPANHP